MAPVDVGVKGVNGMWPARREKISQKYRKYRAVELENVGAEEGR